jgi:hypothetical protein
MDRKRETIESKAVSVCTKGIDRCFEFSKFDNSLQKLLCMPNLTKRSFRELRTKTDEIGTIPNEIACNTLFQITINWVHTKTKLDIFCEILMTLTNFRFFENRHSN